MTKQDVKELPEKVPHKRKHLEQALDLHIAMWLASDDLTPSERRRLEEEKERRKTRVVPVSVGFLGSQEGLTPQQKEEISAILDSTENVVETHIAGEYGGDLQFNQICRTLYPTATYVMHPQQELKYGAGVHVDKAEKKKSKVERDKDIIKDSSLVIAAPREGVEPKNINDASSIWEAIRYARSRDSNLKVVMPDGSVL